MTPEVVKQWRSWVRRYGLEGVPTVIAPALLHLRKLGNTAYRVLADERSSPFVRGLALKMKTKALIRHDRILRGEL